MLLNSISDLVNTNNFNKTSLAEIDNIERNLQQVDVETTFAVGLIVLIIIIVLEVVNVVVLISLCFCNYFKPEECCWITIVYLCVPLVAFVVVLCIKKCCPPIYRAPTTVRTVVVYDNRNNSNQIIGNNGFNNMNNQYNNNINNMNNYNSNGNLNNNNNINGNFNSNFSNNDVISTNRVINNPNNNVDVIHVYNNQGVQPPNYGPGQKIKNFINNTTNKIFG